MTVKLFIRFRVLCLRYLRRATPLGANARIWQHFQNADSQPLDFFQHIFRPENGAERAQTGLRNGHSCTATVAILAFNCGSFASSMGPNEEICGLFRRFKAGFSLWLESFYRGAFVDIIRHSPLLAGTSFSVFHRVCEQHTNWFYHPVSAAPYGFLSKVGSDRNLKFIKQVLCRF